MITDERLIEIGQRIKTIMGNTHLSSRAYSDVEMLEELFNGIHSLRGQLAAKERELEVARLAHKAIDKDRQDALDILDKAGIWTGMDLLISDRVQQLILMLPATTT